MIFNMILKNSSFSCMPTASYSVKMGLAFEEMKQMARFKA
jgi:hypothetical protein